MRGSPLFDQYVTSYKILHSFDGIAFHYLNGENDSPQIFRGPIDSHTPVEVTFINPIEPKIVRIYPLTWHESIAIRFELLGCSSSDKLTTTPKPTTSKPNTTKMPATTVHQEITTQPICDEPLGIENGIMTPNQIEVSSSKMMVKSKLPKVIEMLKMSATKGWSPNTNTQNEFIVFDFLGPRYVTGLVTKGGEYGWVTSYNVDYARDDLVWNTVLDVHGHPKQFLANYDSQSEKRNNFERAIHARYVKLVPTKWHDTIEIKVEPIGCFKPYRK